MSEDHAQTPEQFRDEIRLLFQTMSTNIAGMAKDMGSLKTAVVGDPMMGTTGLVLRMAEAEKTRALDKDVCEKELQKLRDDFRDERARLDKKLAWINGVGALAAMIFAVVLAMIEGGQHFGH